MRQRSVGFVIAVTATVLMTACGTGAASPAPSGTTEARSSIGAPDPGSCEMGPHVCEGPMPPGTYASDTVGAYVEFEVGDGWSGGLDLTNEGFYIQDLTQRAPAAFTVTRFPGEVFTDPCEVGDTSSVDGGASRAAEWIAEQPWAGDASVTESEISGRAATEVSFTVASVCADPVIYLWPMPTSVEFHLNEGEIGRIWFVDTATVTLAFVSEVYPDADVPGFSARVDEILASLTIQD